MLIIFLAVLALVWIIFAVVSDLRTKEIPNWLSFSLIIFALGIRLFYSIFNDMNFSFFIQGVFGLAVFFVLANLLYYVKFFAGGDAKLMIALGPILPFSTGFLSNTNLFSTFFFIFLMTGAAYGLIMVFRLSIKRFSKIKREFSKQIKLNKKKIIISLIFGIILMLSGYWYSSLFIFGIWIFLMPYLLIYAKSVDECCMVERIQTSKLTEGDWLYGDIKSGRDVVKAKWEGLSMKEIKLLRKRHRFVTIRTGIQFSPVFLISFLIYAYLFLAEVDLWNSLW